jgi:predicted RNase H-like HicB family nuclease
MKKRQSPKREGITTTVGTKYACYFSPEPGGGYVVSSPSVPPLGAYGKTLDKARATAREEIEAWEEEAERLRDHYSAVCYTQSP